MDAQAPLLDVRSLSVEFCSRRSNVAAVRDLSFTVRHGETLAIVGESGSGKSVTALSLMRLIEHEGGTITGGEMLFQPNGSGQIDLARLDEVQMRAVRGNAISMVFQEPMTSLNPILTIGDQVTEVLLLHRAMNRREAEKRAIELFDRVQLSDPERRMAQYPHELSGGMRQRVMIAMALACAPKLLIADEPTTALDVTIQAGILDLIRILQRDTGTAVIFITHDMGVVAEIADRIVVMRNGERVEAGETGSVFRSPQAPYTRALLDAVPRLGAGAPVYAAPAPPRDLSGKAAMIGERGSVLRVENLVTRFPVRKGPFRRHVANIHAVEGISLNLRRGETLGLVGESGSGKSTIGRSILKLVAPHSGRVHVEGQDITEFGPQAMRPVRKHIQMVFQDPYASLNPRLSVAELVTEPLAIHTSKSAAERREIAVGLLKRVELPVDSLDRYPHQFSGGQRQRLCIARALSSRPRIIIADEPVSALDVSVQKQVIELMRELQDEFGIAYLFISHDLAVVEQVSHRIAVLDRGRIVETGPTNAILADPRHHYTRLLLAAVPVADPARRGTRLEVVAPRERKSPMHPIGYVPPAQDFSDMGDGHLVAVH
ncbi:MAG: ABC transporter ATP-binding protein [Alphaproteobacteria bacterium]|nr:ABC transporter ATP-binding protein [Alphaproteobacteria bacterium]